MTALLDPPRWIKPPQHAPEYASSDATPFAKAHFNTIIFKKMIALY